MATFEYKFSDSFSIDDTDGVIVEEIRIRDLIPYDGQPFHPYTSEALAELAADIRLNGVLSPVIVRPRGGGKYQILAGHNRVAASKLASLNEVPAIIKDVDDEQAALIMVNTNLNQRHELLPSEKAWAYRIQYNALKRQGKRNDLTLCQNGTKTRADEEMAKNTSDSARTIQRYIRLTYLEPELLEMVDDGKINFTIAVELSYLNETHQSEVRRCIEDGYKLTTEKVAILREEEPLGKLSSYRINEIMINHKKFKPKPFKVSRDIMSKYSDKLPEEDSKKQKIFEIALKEYFERHEC